VCGYHIQITNTELWRKNDQESMLEQLERKWNQLGHTQRRSDDNILKQALQWTTQSIEKDSDQRT